MSNNLVRGLLCVGLFLIVVVTVILKRGRIPMKFALVWYVPSFAIVLLALVPSLFEFVANIFGFQTISNLVAGFLFVILFLIIIALTVIIAGQTTKINLLIQEVSMLKKKVNDNEK
ncbi:DUF2304 domain-containing protein [Thomasclavelia saccharogumia]|uniref:DUF2304 domain-containing protein n=1 Tax=Thomasclavelia saccharogumia TaxID=341225 RepID=UPI00047EF1EA|nr:DUF2304 domain-containing protein [Thomasclavelia saccharogumia]